MGTGRAEVDWRRIYGAVARDLDPGVADRELLRRFADNRDEAAFAALVRRHAAMVLATGRRVLGDAHHAEDVCQAAFLLLAQKAQSHQWQPSVASWLHKTAHLLALKARRSAARRARHEGRAAARPPANPLAEITGQELLALLDEELLTLPEPLRAPLVLCYLQGATRDEAARRLGCPLATLKKRLERGRERLHAALSRRGLGPPAALLVALLVGEAVAAPLGLAAGTARAAAALTSGASTKGMISPAVSQLLNGGIGMAVRNKLTAALAVLLIGGLLAVAAYGSGGEKQGPEVTVKPGTKPQLPAEQARELRVLVLDPQGKPLPGANVHAGIWTNEKGFKANQSIDTDARGVARVGLPRTYYILRLWARKKPFVAMFANWGQAELSSGNGVPVEYTFRLEAAATAGGRVLDEKGRPVAGAKVRVSLDSAPQPARGDGRVSYNTWLAEGESAPTTDAAGRWKIDNAPDRPGVKLSLLVTHPDYVADYGSTAEGAGVTAKALRAGTATLTLKAGVIVRGRVTDPAGKPVKDAVVIQGDDPYRGRTTSKFATDAEGRYRLPALPVGMRSLTVIAPGFAPRMRKIDLKVGLPAQDFQMAAGKPVRLRTVDDAGKPVPGASVWLMEWKGSKSVYTDHNTNHPGVPDNGIPRRAGPDGVWEWGSAPDEPVKARVFATGFASRNLDVTGGAGDRTVTLRAEHRVTGTVTDAVTGKPIPAFAVIPVDVFRKDFLTAERFNAERGRDGRLDYLATRTDIPLRLRVEALGYRTQDGPEFRVGDGALRQDFRLRPSPPRAGTVVDAAGRPAAKARVLLATPTEPGGPWQGGSSIQRGGADTRWAFTDAAGRFEFPDPGEPWAVVAETDVGFAFAEFPAGRADAGTLKLRPWGSVHGTFHDGGKPVRGATVFVSPIRLDRPGRPRFDADTQAVTDADGRFELPRVPPGPVSVRVSLGPWRDEGFRSGPTVPLDLKPGERARLDLGSGGATLTGKVKLTGKVPAGLDCTYSLNYLVRREPGVAPPPELAARIDVMKGWRNAWHRSAEGDAYLSTLRTWFVKLPADGTFRVSGVPAGEYDLAVAVYAKPSGCLTDPLAQRVVRVSVTAADVTRGELKLPEVAAEVVPVPAVGDAPALTFQRAGGKAGTLADLRGKYTLVHFWASWCAPCKEQMPALRKLHERLGGRGLAALGLSLDEDAEAWQSALKGLELPWPQGRLRGGAAPGVSSVPAYWLLDPGGRIVANGYDLAELAKEIEGRLK